MPYKRKAPVPYRRGRIGSLDKGWTFGLLGLAIFGTAWVAEGGTHWKLPPAPPVEEATNASTNPPSQPTSGVSEGAVQAPPTGTGKDETGSPTNGGYVLAPHRYDRFSDPEFTCGSKRYCTQMTSCEEATYYYQKCGLSRLDGDSDGTPCENLCDG